MDADVHAQRREFRETGSVPSESRNAECPFSGTWKSGGKVRGRYACTVDQTSSSLFWSLDNGLISVYARAYDTEMTTKEFLSWWNDEAGPLT